MTLLEEFAALLAELDLGTYQADGATGGTIFTTKLPSTPDRCMAVARYGGAESDSRNPWDQPSIQIRCRGSATDSREAEADAQAVYDALHGLGMRTLPGGTWLQLAICGGGGPVYIGTDQNGRHEYVVNARCDIDHETPQRA
ncbi:minor capsid protein [Microbispora rosea]|uniref:minor capsid protein n=1 Tax=Microbispora rosea TaxID=58117 RepID=UPI003420C9B0